MTEVSVRITEADIAGISRGLYVLTEAHWTFPVLAVEEHMRRRRA